MRGNVAATELLIQAGAEVDAKTTMGQTPLHFASRHGHYDVTEALLRCGADINAADVDGRTPLHLAAGGYTEHAPSVTSLLLRHHANINTKDYAQWTPLHYSVRNGTLQDIKHLPEHGANANAVDVENYPAIVYAIARARHDAARIFAASSSQRDLAED